MNRKILFGCFLLSLLGFAVGLLIYDSYYGVKDSLLVWFAFSIPLIVYYAYFKIVKGGE